MAFGHLSGGGAELPMLWAGSVKYTKDVANRMARSSVINRITWTEIPLLHLPRNRDLWL